MVHLAYNNVQQYNWPTVMYSSATDVQLITAVQLAYSNVQQYN